MPTSPEVFHGSLSKFDMLDAAQLGSNTGAPSAALGFFFATSPAVAASYASTTVVRMGEAQMTLDRISPEIRRLTGENFIAAEFALRRGRYDDQPWVEEVRHLLECHSDANDLLGEIEYGYAEPAPTLAGDGHLYRATLRYENPFVFDYRGERRREDDSSYFHLITAAKDAGHDAVILVNTRDPGDIHGDHLTNIYIVFDAASVEIHQRVQGEEAQAIIDAYVAASIEEVLEEPPHVEGPSAVAVAASGRRR